MSQRISLTASILLALATITFAQSAKDDGYRGIWYANQPSNDEYRPHLQIADGDEGGICQAGNRSLRDELRG